VFPGGSPVSVKTIVALAARALVRKVVAKIHAMAFILSHGEARGCDERRKAR
jgi:hypothetical protein